jgi:uncharacterized delta-60 repeat protein
VASDSSGNIYVTGTSYDSNGTSNYVTIKYDSNSNQKWVARYNGPANSDEDARSIALDISGNVYVTGMSYSSTEADYATIKYDPNNGSQKWFARYSGTANIWDEAYAIAIDNNSGNIYVTGTSYNSSENADYATIKYDPNGIQKWAARYNGTANSDDSVVAIASDSSGNIYVTGTSYDSNGRSDYATVKYNSSGSQRWAARCNGPENGGNDARAMALDSSGNIYVTGASSDSSGNGDFMTVKYDPNGNQKWAAPYAGPANGWDSPGAIVLDSSGNVYVSGESYNGTDADYATIKYDPNGNQKWVVFYNGPGNSNDYAIALALDISGNIYVTGESVGSDTSEDYATVKYDPNGNQKWVIRYNGQGNNTDYARAVTLDSLGNVYVTGESLGDTDTDYATIKYIQNECISKIEGDFNNDCRVNFEDFAVFMSHWLECNLAPSSACGQ